MFIPHGARSTGRVYTDANELVSTTFFHVFFVPVFPVEGCLVTKKRLLLDEGEKIPLNKKSVLAGYLRNGLFAAACLGFSMTVDGLFLITTDEKNQSELLTAGTSIFIAASFLWSLALFGLGAKRDPESFAESSLARVAGGMLGMLALLALAVGASQLVPREPTLESIEADRTITDEQAIRGLVGHTFPKDAIVQMSREAGGIQTHVSYVDRKDPSMRVLAQQGKDDAARMHKAMTAISLLFDAQRVIEHGRSRHLSKLSVSLATTVLGQDGQPQQVEAYRITISKEKFDEVINTKVTGKQLMSADKVLDQLGIVDADNFSTFEFHPGR